MWPAADAPAYYDAHVDGKIRDFVDGNRRVDAAWRTVERWMPPDPRRVLEIGCGLGSMAWRIARRWPSASVLGTDTSERSICCGRQLFQEPNLEFACRSAENIDAGGGWDVIALIDVYEHIPAGDRGRFNAALGRLLRKGGRIVLTFPTVRYQQWLRATRPEKLQPVDEDVDLNAIALVAAACSADVLKYEVVSIWNGGDYAHAVVGTHRIEDLMTPPPVSSPSLTDRLAGKWPRLFRTHAEWPGRTVRLSMIERTFGRDACPIP